jgi:hypothetical protein
VGLSPQAIEGLPAATLAVGPQAQQADGPAWQGEDLVSALQDVLERESPQRRRLLAIRSQDSRIHALNTEILPVGQHGGRVRALLLAQEGSEASI